jgi:hypothetical protein
MTQDVKNEIGIAYGLDPNRKLLRRFLELKCAVGYLHDVLKATFTRASPGIGIDYLSYIE